MVVGNSWVVWGRLSVGSGIDRGLFESGKDGTWQQFTHQDPITLSFPSLTCALSFLGPGKYGGVD